MRSANSSTYFPDKPTGTTPFGRLSRGFLLSALALLGVGLSACTTSETPTKPVEVQSDQTSTKLTQGKDMSKRSEQAASTPPARSVPAEIMQKLVTAVASEAGVSTDEVKLDRAEKTTFSDGSLDCPQPNMAYSQATVEGYWVVFHVGREEYDLRVTDRGTFLRCQGSTKRAPIRYDDT